MASGSMVPAGPERGEREGRRKRSRGRRGKTGAVGLELLLADGSWWREADGRSGGGLDPIEIERCGRSRAAWEASWSLDFDRDGLDGWRDAELDLVGWEDKWRLRRGWWRKTRKKWLRR